MRHEDWRWTIDVDLWGPIHGVEVFLPHIRAAGEGHVLFTASFAGLVPNVGLGPYCVAKYGVVALAEVLHKEMRNEGIGVSVLCPMRVATNIGNSGRNRQAQYGEDSQTSLVPDQSEVNQDLAGIVMNVEEVAAQVLAAIDNNRLYILPHEESRPFIQRRFQRIEDAFMD
jgi:short-subunit dehydrogenase